MQEAEQKQQQQQQHMSHAVPPDRGTTSSPANTSAAAPLSPRQAARLRKGPAFTSPSTSSLLSSSSSSQQHPVQPLLQQRERAGSVLSSGSSQRSISAYDVEDNHRRAGDAVIDSDRSHLYSPPFLLEEDKAWAGRRPSITSSQSGSSANRVRRQSTTTSSQSHYQTPHRSRRPSSSHSQSAVPISSPPTTPTVRTSSRSKILASSAKIIEGQPALPQELRTAARKSSAGEQSPLDADIYITRHVSPPLPRVSSAPLKSSKSNILASTSASPSIAERRKQLATASGNALVFEDQSHSDTQSVRSTQPLNQRPRKTDREPAGGTFASSQQTSVPTMARSASTVSTSTQSSEVNAVKEADSKSSLRSRLFGAKKTPPRDRDQAAKLSALPDDASTAPQSITVPHKTTRKEEAKSSSSSTATPVASSFLATVDGFPTADVPLTSHNTSKAAAETLDGSMSALGMSKVPSSEAKRALSAGRNPSHDRLAAPTWITSLSSLSPPEMPDLLQSRLGTPSPTNSASSYNTQLQKFERERYSPELEKDKKSQLLRTESWPAGGSKGSLVSVTGTGIGKGYRFEKAASQARRSPTAEAHTASFLDLDHSTSYDDTSNTSSLRKEALSSTIPISPSKVRPVKLGSPAMLDVDTFPAAPKSPDSEHSTSLPATRGVRTAHAGDSARSPPKERIPRTNEEGKRRSRALRSHSTSLADAELARVEEERSRRRGSGSIYSGRGGGSSSVQSNYSSPVSPSTFARRTSSLLGQSPSSTGQQQVSKRDSYRSAASPTELQSNLMHLEARAQQDMQGESDRSSREAMMSINSNSAAGAAGAGAIAAIRARFGEDATHAQNGEGRAESNSDHSRTSPQSLLTAKQDLSPSSAAMSIPEEEEAQARQEAYEGARLSVPAIKEEPKRPTKSPLRVVSGATSSISSRVGSPVPIPSADRRVASTPLPDPVSSYGTAKRPSKTERQKLQSLHLGQSPPRKSIEAVVQLDAMTFSMSSEQLARIPSDSSAYQTTSKEVILQPVPESAKKLGAVMRSDKADNSVRMRKASSSSLSTTHDKDANGSQSHLKSVAKRYKSFRKVTPPALASAFSKSSAKGVDVAESLAEEEDESGEMERKTASGSTTPTTLSKRKTKRWPFGKESNPDADAEDEGSLPSKKGSRSLKSLRSRKTEPIVSSRPTIRRVFEDPSDAESPVEVASGVEGDSVGDSADGPYQAARDDRLESRDSLGPQAMASMPSEELTPDLRRILQRRNVIRELVETEKSYASDLAVVRDLYLSRAKQLVGLPLNHPCAPLSNHTTPAQSPVSTPASTHSAFITSQSSYRSSPLISASQRMVQRMVSAESALPPSPVLSNHAAFAAAAASPTSFASSSAPSNRSSTYTTSSQTSQTSDSSFPFQVGQDAPPMPATPPNLSGVSASASTNTVQPFSPSLNSSSSTFSLTKNATGKPRMNPATDSPLLNSFRQASSIDDVGLTSSDVRVIFAHLDTCCAFAGDMANMLAGTMGSLARSRKSTSVTFLSTMEKEDDSLGETFLSLMKRIRVVYLAYCSRHEASILRLREILTKSALARYFFKDCTEQARKYTNAWDLSSLLIKPVQRVLKYPLLLQQIISSTLESHPDHANLIAAYGEIQSVADEINQVKKRRDLADQIITGRIKDAQTMTPPSTLGRKKKAAPSGTKAQEAEGLLVPLGTEQAILSEYASLLAGYQALLDRVLLFGQQAEKWSILLREKYERELLVMQRLQSIYRLQTPSQAEEVNPMRSDLTERKEEITVSIYIKLIGKILDHCWRSTDDDIRATIPPMARQIYHMFDPPQQVILKRNEREVDYQRYRAVSQAGKQADRKVLDNANGFLALNAQLVDELPLFVAGVQTLLDVGVQAFARLQAAHFEQVHRMTLEFWSDTARKEAEIVTLPDIGMPSIRYVNPVREFWERHSGSAALMEGLSMVNKRGAGKYSANGYESAGMESVGGSEVNSAASTPAITSMPAFGESEGDEDDDPPGTLASTLVLPDGDADELQLSNTPLGSSTPTNAFPTVELQTPSQDTRYLLPTTGARRPGGAGITGLMRTLSGTFSRDHSSTHHHHPGETVPPLPTKSTSFHHTPGSSATSHKKKQESLMPPSLPSLVFRKEDGEGGGEDGEGGFFIQMAPIPFLDREDMVSRKEPYDVTPSLFPTSNPIEDDSPLSTRMSRSYSDISVDPSPSTPKDDQETASTSKPVRHKMKVLFRSIAVDDYAPDPLLSHLGWPYLEVVKGDVLRVLSTDNTHSNPLLFGRIDRTAHLGWISKQYFA